MKTVALLVLVALLAGCGVVKSTKNKSVNAQVGIYGLEVTASDAMANGSPTGKLGFGTVDYHSAPMAAGQPYYARRTTNSLWTDSPASETVIWIGTASDTCNLMVETIPLGVVKVSADGVKVGESTSVFCFNYATDSVVYDAPPPSKLTVSSAAEHAKDERQVLELSKLRFPTTAAEAVIKSTSASCSSQASDSAVYGDSHQGKLDALDAWAAEYEKDPNRLLESIRQRMENTHRLMELKKEHSATIPPADRLPPVGIPFGSPW